MKPMIDDIELPLIQEIGTHDRRVLVEHKPPGMDGSLLQNLGRRPARLVLWGISAREDTHGSEAREAVQKLDEKFREGKPVSFVADITTDSAIEKMVIDDFQIQELAGKPNRFAYTLALREFIEPAEPENLAAVDTGVLEDATGLVDDLLGGLDIATTFASGLERFATSMGDLLGRLQEFKNNIESARGG
jgi:hypothetical protein